MPLSLRRRGRRAPRDYGSGGPGAEGRGTGNVRWRTALMSPIPPGGGRRRSAPRKEVLSSQVGVDATHKHKFPARSIPPQEDMDRIDRQWADDGLA